VVRVEKGWRESPRDLAPKLASDCDQRGLSDWKLLDSSVPPVIIPVLVVRSTAKTLPVSLIRTKFPPIQHPRTPAFQQQRAGITGASRFLLAQRRVPETGVLLIESTRCPAARSYLGLATSASDAFWPESGYRNPVGLFPADAYFAAARSPYLKIALLHCGQATHTRHDESTAAGSCPSGLRDRPKTHNARQEGSGRLACNQPTEKDE
jgi:hypothetical protein